MLIFLHCYSRRVGHHSTSDDWSAYRSADEVSHWDKIDHPIVRLRLHLQKQDLWNDDLENELKKECRQNVMNAMKKAEKIQKPNLYEIFSDVYDDMPEILKDQQRQLQEHLQNYKDEYPLDKFQS